VWRDLSRRHYGPQRNAVLYLSDDDGTVSHAPLHVDGDAKQQQRLEEQRELREQLHEQIDLLSDEHKEMFNLIHYLELSQAEVAEQLGVSVRTIKRKWRAAQLALTDQIKNESTE
ncbi:MAG: sigma-70 family RNA polymerase sigma factor, partial [Planctomycetales bacterium]